MWKLSKASLVAPILAAFVMFVYATVNVADTSSAPEEGAVSSAPAGTLTSGPATIRTPQQVMSAAAEAARAPLPPAVGVPFRPTIGLSEYKSAKAVAAKGARPDGPGRGEAPEPLGPPTIILKNLEGVNQTTAGGLRPPDTHGAIGANHFVEITNSHLDVYTRAGTLVKSVTLASFFGYTLETIFDPRVVYDRTWNRWVMSAEAFAETSTIQRQFLAISLTHDPTGAFYVYRIDVNTRNNDDFWDYPQLGMDQDAVIVTANIFGPVSYRTTRMFAVAKARLYNGLAFSVPMHTGLVGTLAPPIVLDQNNNAFLVAAPTSGTSVRKYTLSNASNPSQQTLTSVLIPVTSYTTPPDASQPGTTNKLDTLDARFVNASTQIGTSLWQVHTINFGGRPRPRWYQFNTATNAITQSGTFGESSVSHDWNASIVANTANTAVFVTWSSTKTGTGAHHARVRFSGRRSTDTAGVIAAGGSLFTSPTFYNPSSSTVERWGDYSAVTIDPTNGLRAWIVNEKINSASVWGTRIGQIGY